VAANPDAEVLWRVEEMPRHDARLVLLAQQTIQLLHAASKQLREGHRPKRGTNAGEVVAGLKKAVEHRTVRGQYLRCALGNAIEIVEGNRAQPLGGMRRVYAVQIVNVPHALYQLRRSQHPSAAQSAQAVGFRQAAGYEELLAKMDRRPRTLLEHRLEIDLIHQHPRIALARKLADRTQRRFVDER